MKALIYDPESLTTLSLIEIKKPQLNSNNAIVKVKGVGVCGSDLLKLNHGLVKPSTVLGHEMVGIIDQISDQMSSKYGLQIGDRIVSSHHVPCMKCKFCINGKESLCKEFKESNFEPGAFCEYLSLGEGHLKRTVQKIPESLSNEEASFIEPVACCIKAIEKSRIRTHQGSARVLVLGLGSIGLIIGQLVKHYCHNVELTGIDLLDAKLKLARDLRFDHAYSNVEGEFEYIFLCAGAKATVDIAIKHANLGATIVVFSSAYTKEDEFIGFTNNDVYYKELTVLGSYSPNLTNLSEALSLLSSRAIQVSSLISHRASLENLGETINLCAQEQGIKTYLML